MDLTIVDPVEMYRARVEQQEREWCGHQMLQQEIRDNPDITGDDEKAALEDSAAAVKRIEVAHGAAKKLLAKAEKDKPPPPADG